MVRFYQSSALSLGRLLCGLKKYGNSQERGKGEKGAEFLSKIWFQGKFQ